MRKSNLLSAQVVSLEATICTGAVVYENGPFRVVQVEDEFVGQISLAFGWSLPIHDRWLNMGEEDCLAHVHSDVYPAIEECRQYAIAMDEVWFTDIGDGYQSNGHSASCNALETIRGRQIENFDHVWPRHCKRCHAHGLKTIPATRNDPGEPEYCPDCLECSLCPRCHQEGFVDDNETPEQPLHCTACGWTEGKPEHARPHMLEEDDCQCECPEYLRERIERRTPMTPLPVPSVYLEHAGMYVEEVKA